MNQTQSATLIALSSQFHTLHQKIHTESISKLDAQQSLAQTFTHHSLKTALIPLESSLSQSLRSLKAAHVSTLESITRSHDCTLSVLAASHINALRTLKSRLITKTSKALYKLHAQYEYQAPPTTTIQKRAKQRRHDKTDWRSVRAHNNDFPSPCIQSLSRAEIAVDWEILGLDPQRSPKKGRKSGGGGGSITESPARSIPLVIDDQLPGVHAHQLPPITYHHERVTLPSVEALLKRTPTPPSLALPYLQDPSDNRLMSKTGQILSVDDNVIMHDVKGCSKTLCKVVGFSEDIIVLQRIDGTVTRVLREGVWSGRIMFERAG